MRIAVLGAGSMGEVHARSYADMDGVEVAAVLGRDEKRVAPLARDVGAMATTDFDAILNDSSIDHKSRYSDPTTELMTFDFDAVNWLLGQPDEVYATATRLPGGRPGHVLATLRYGRATVGVEASGVMPPSWPYRVGFRFVGSTKAIEIATEFLPDGPPDTTVTAYPARGAPEELVLDGGDPYEAECRYFVACLRGEADPSLVAAERAIGALELSLATQVSIETARPVRIGRGTDVCSP